MSACNTFTEHVWKPGECKNCFKPKSLHCLNEGGPRKGPPDQKQQDFPPAGTKTNANLANSSQRSSSSARSGHFRPPVAKKPTIAVKPTMMLPCSSVGLDLEGNHRPADGTETGKTSAFTVWNHNGLNQKTASGPNNNEGEDCDQMKGYVQIGHHVASSSSNNNGLTDVLKEIAGLGSGPSTSSRDDFLDRISSSYRRSLERGLPAAGCLGMGSSGSAAKRVSLSDSTEIISTEGGRFCYPEFSSDGEDDEDDEYDESERDDEHESWDESDEELLAMEIRMRGQPRFANFRAATLSPVPFAAGKKWNTVPLRNRSLQRICAVDYDDSYDEILNGYPSVDANGDHSLLPYRKNELQGSGFLSKSESATSPESSSSMPEDSHTSSSSSSTPFGNHNGLYSPSATREPLLRSDVPDKEFPHRALSSPKATETHKAVLAIRLEDQDACHKEGGALPQALPGQPITISFSPTEEQAKPYRVVNLDKPLICKPYTVVDVSASMASTDEYTPDNTPKPKGLSTPVSPPPYPGSPVSLSLSAGSPMSPASPTTVSQSTSNSSVTSSSHKKPGNIRYQEVWTSSTSPRQKIPKVELVSGGASGPSVPPRICSHKSAPTSPISGLSSSRTVPVKSPNLSEIKFNSYNNAGMPPFPIIIRDEPTYARSCKNAVKVPIVINPSAYDNLAVYKSFLGVGGELPQPKPGVGGRVTSHTYEEIGSSESVQPPPSEKAENSKLTGDTATSEDSKTCLAFAMKSYELNNRTTMDPNIAPSVTLVSPVSPSFAPSPHSGSLSKCTTAFAMSGRIRKPSNEAGISNENNNEVVQSATGTGHREKASTVLSQIVASIQPPQSPPESPSTQGKACSSEELYAVPPDAAKQTLSRPKSLFSSTDGCLSRSRKETPTKQLPKSQSASAAVAPTSPKSDSGAPFPPPRSTSSPYHASNLLQRHFSNWTKPSPGSCKPSDGETSPVGGDSRRSASENAKPKRWISFKSFFRRRKDEDEQRERLEREKEKGKLVGLDGTVITMLPPPPSQRRHWFAEAKTDDPSQKPTIIFTYKPDSSAMSDGEGELRVEESAETGERSRPLSPGQSAPHSRASLLISKVMSQVPVDGREDEIPSATSLPAKLELSSIGEVGAAVRPGANAAPASEGSASLGEPEEEGSHSHSHSPTSSSCSATYSNLGQSRVSMIPLKHPRNPKASDDTLASGDLDTFDLFSKATPPPLPKKGTVGRSSTDAPGQCKELMSLRPKGEAKPGGTNLSVANPLYDLDSTWETASQSSSLSSDMRLLDQESGDSLERPVAVGKNRPTNSLSSLTTANSSAAGRERRGYRSVESLADRARTTGRGSSSGVAGVKAAGTTSKPQRQALYKGMDSWEEVVGRIRGLHTDTLRKLAGKCEDRFMAGQKDHLRFGTDSWSHFRLTTGRPCCEAGDAVYYTASYAKDPLVNYAIKICRSKVKETQQQFFHSLAVRQSLPLHFNIQQDCGHFLADVPSRLLPWEEDNGKEGESGDDDKKKNVNKVENVHEKCEREPGEKKTSEKNTETLLCGAPNGQAGDGPACSSGTLQSRVVVITREVPFQTVADFVREGQSRHVRNPDLYERQVCLLLLQLCAGLEHMKPYHVTHCDLRLENLLLVHCNPSNLWNLDLQEPNNNTSAGAAGTSSSAGTSACPARLIISNFSQAKQKGAVLTQHTAESTRNQSRLAPEIITATQYRKCDEFQTGILIYEMLHRPNPFEEFPELKEREYSLADLPFLPARSLYSQGLQQLAGLLLNANPSERIQMGEAWACLQCLLWGPREDLFQALSSSTGPGHRQATLQNWLDLKRTLMMIKFAERSLDTGCGVSLEDWLCCQYLAFSTPETLSKVIRILQQPQEHHI